MKKKKIGIRVRNRIWAAILAAALMTGQGVISGDSYASVARAEEQVYSSAVEGDGSRKIRICWILTRISGKWRRS